MGLAGPFMDIDLDTCGQNVGDSSKFLYAECRKSLSVIYNEEGVESNQFKRTLYKSSSCERNTEFQTSLLAADQFDCFEGEKDYLDEFPFTEFDSYLKIVCTADKELISTKHKLADCSDAPYDTTEGYRGANQAQCYRAWWSRSRWLPLA